MPELAARVSDMHTCPAIDPRYNGNGTVTMVPHVGGPILPPGTPTVLIGGMPAATVGALCICTGALGGQFDSIIKGSSTVMIEGKSAARRGDPTAHHGVIVAGAPTVFVGG